MSQAFADQVMEETLKADLRAYIATRGTPTPAARSEPTPQQQRYFQYAVRSTQYAARCLVEDHSAELASIASPVLIVWGTADGIFTEEDQLALLDRRYGTFWTISAAFCEPRVDVARRTVFSSDFCDAFMADFRLQGGRRHFRQCGPGGGQHKG